MLNKWTELEKGLYLAVSLRGQAQGVLGNLPNTHKHDYVLLVNALEERFAPSNQNDLYRTQLRERRQRATETLPELGQSIRRLTSLAYPTAPRDVQETLTKEQFIDALQDADMRLRIKQARPLNLNDAIRHAVELEAFVKSDRKMFEKQTHLRPMQSEKTEGNKKDRSDQISTSILVELKDEIRKLLKEVNDMKTKNSQDVVYKKKVGATSNRRCYLCGSPNHFRYDCPQGYRTQQNAAAQKKYSYNTKKHPVQNTFKCITSYKAQVGVNQIDPEAGMYVKTTILGIEANLLVDTGATLSVLSSKVYEAIQNKPVLYKTNQIVSSACGTDLTVKGKTSICINLGESFYCQDVIVADFSLDGVIGLDFMKKYNCTIDIVNGYFKVNNKVYKVDFFGKIGCFRINSKEVIVVPARSEIVTYCKVSMP
ncbi:uncharacterized protein LOC134241021 [Saccostrea cucullata]|uniref:uncharacterized protein LOC134241021 n=1 Tax=Saccostrea cuccullata TaxID=36930 RepID=UPI002ED30640